MFVNPELIALASWRLEDNEKQAFVPPPDPSGGAGGQPAPGGAPADPSAAGGGGGAPAPDPLAGITQQMQQMQQQIQQMQMGGGGGGMGGGAGGMGGAKPPKMDGNMAAMDSFHNKKLLMGLFNYLNIPLPQDILDGPGRDPRTGFPMAMGAPGSTSDPSQQSTGTVPSPQQQPQSSIPPIEPMQPAVMQPTQPGGGAGGAPGTPKMAEFEVPSIGSPHSVSNAPIFDNGFTSRAEALSTILAMIGK